MFVCIGQNLPARITCQLVDGAMCRPGYKLRIMYVIGGGGGGGVILLPTVPVSFA